MAGSETSAEKRPMDVGKQPDPVRIQTKADRDVATSRVKHIARHVVEEDGTVYLPGQELPVAGHGSPRRHELLAGGWVVDPDQKEG